jgi:predicted nucleotidyltransferase
MDKDEEKAILGSIVKSVLSVADPLKIVLFGSRARGDCRDDSDFEVLVIIRNLEDEFEATLALNRASSH